MCQRWALDNEVILATSNFMEPVGLDSRAADNWEPLLQIAALASATWLEHAAAAATGLTQKARTREREEDIVERLLSDIRSLAQDARFGERVSMVELCRLLTRLADAPWTQFSNGRPLTTHQLGKLLRDFDVEPKTLRFGAAAIAKGYTQEQFCEAYERYLPPLAVTSVTSSEPLEKPGFEAELHPAPVTTQLVATNINGAAAVTDVTASGLMLQGRP